MNRSIEPNKAQKTLSATANGSDDKETKEVISKGKTCSSCKEEIVRHSIYITLPGGQVFHQHCIKQRECYITTLLSAEKNTLVRLALRCKCSRTLRRQEWKDLESNPESKKQLLEKLLQAVDTDTIIQECDALNVMKHQRFMPYTADQDINPAQAEKTVIEILHQPLPNGRHLRKTKELLGAGAVDAKTVNAACVKPSLEAVDVWCDPLEIKLVHLAHIIKSEIRSAMDFPGQVSFIIQNHPIKNPQSQTTFSISNSRTDEEGHYQCEVISGQRAVTTTGTEKDKLHLRIIFSNPDAFRKFYYSIESFDTLWKNKKIKIQAYNLLSMDNHSLLETVIAPTIEKVTRENPLTLDHMLDPNKIIKKYQPWLHLYPDNKGKPNLNMTLKVFPVTKEQQMLILSQSPDDAPIHAPNTQQ